MERKAVRNQEVRGISFRIARMLQESQSLDELAKAKGKDYILRECLGEKDNSYTDLWEKYAEFINKENLEYFSWMYVLKEGVGVIIDSHIYVCKFNADIDEQLRKMFGWGYIEGKHFLGDAWWFEDEEIISDVNDMNIVDFLIKYKGI